MARIKDTDPGWIKQSFILPENSISEEDLYSRVISTANFKYTDTTVGGNFTINTPPQFTRYADMKTGGLSWGDGAVAGDMLTRAPSDLSGNRSHGMGRYYSEAIDDNGQIVTMRFGVPEYNSLLMFFGTFYKHSEAVLARSGRGSSLAFAAGKVAGAVVALPFQPLILGMQIYRFLSKSPPSKFYYLKPTMPLYWNAVNTIANGIAVNMGLIPPLYSDDQNDVMGMQPYNGEQAVGNNTARDRENAGIYRGLLPGIYTARGGIDLFAVATRAQRLASHYNAQMAASLDNSGGHSLRTLRDVTRSFAEQMRAGPAMQALSGFKGIDEYLNSWFGITNNVFTNNDSTDVALAGDRSQYDNAGGGGNPEILELSGVQGGGGRGFGDFFINELKEGASFVNFKVDFSSESSESFSNSTKESELAGKINSMSASNRETRINFADGNIGDGPISSLVEGTLGMVRDVAAGLAEGLHLSGLMALAGNAFVDIPKHWDNSSIEFPRADFTIQLRSPYGNKMSRFQNLFIPLSMLLAGALPLSTGKHSYTSPFICELYCKGRNTIRLGMIDRLSITRGVGNMGWSQDDEPLGIDISFSVVDMSTVLHMPIKAHFSLWKNLATAAADGANSETAQAFLTMTDKDMYDDDNSFTDYLAVLGSLNFNDQVFPTRQWRLRRLNRQISMESWRSPAHMANWFFGTLPGRALQAIAVNTDRTN